MNENLGNKELEQLLGINKITFHNCIIAVVSDGRAFLVKSENNFEEVFDGSNLEDTLTNTNNIPREPGIYSCVIKYYANKCNIPIDPEEWDIDIEIVSYQLIEFVYYLL